MVSLTRPATVVSMIVREAMTYVLLAIGVVSRGHSVLVALCAACSTALNRKIRQPSWRSLPV